MSETGSRCRARTGARPELRLQRTEGLNAASPRPSDRVHAPSDHGVPPLSAGCVFTSHVPTYPRTLGGCLVLIGLMMAVGGFSLVILGGSTYYLVASLFLLVSGFLLHGRRRSGAWVYLAALILTIAWAVSEVGFDFWLLMPRVGGPLAIGLVFLIFWARARFGRQSVLSYQKPLGVSSRAAACVTVLVAVAAIGWGYFFLTGKPSSLATEPILEPAAPIGEGADEWRHYGNTLKGQRYAPAAQLSPANVSKLEVAWTYRTGEMPRDDDPRIVTFEATPIQIRDTLYLCSPRNVVIALDAETGEQRWRYDPRVQIAPSMPATCRGVSFHETAPKTVSQCQRRIIFGSGDARLIALDADSGELCSAFGENGVVDLRRGMGEIKAGQYGVTSAPTIVGDIAIVGGQISNKNVSDGPSGVIRAFNVITGALVWNWDSARPDKTTPLEPDETYTRSSPNSWGPASADEGFGLVYLPTSGQPPEAWGGYRDPVGERYSNAIVALEAATGRVRWTFQTVHHDLWNLDIGAQPTLVDIQTASGIRQALLAVTKRGDIFVLDRRTGEPIVPAPEKPVAQGAAPADKVSPTQPFSELSFQPETLSEKDMWGVAPIDHLWCRNQFRQYRYQGIFTPQTHEGYGSLIYPSHYGVFNWGGAAVDEQRQIMVVNPSYVAYYSRLIPRNPPHLAIVRGKVATGAQEETTPEAPFKAEYGAFLSPLGIPCNAPPWGQLAAVDLRTNKVLWQRKLGMTHDRGLGFALPLGVPSLGGPMLTQTGLVFIGATIDNYLRAFDILTGEELWRRRLPAGGQATPMTYISAESGRQFVVISAGGHGGLGTQRGDYVIAFALPKSAVQGLKIQTRLSEPPPRQTPDRGH